MPCFDIFVAPSSKSHLYSSIIEGSGVVEDRASKFTDSPAFISSLSAVNFAFGLRFDSPLQPASEVTINIDVTIIVKDAPVTFINT